MKGWEWLKDSVFMGPTGRRNIVHPMRRSKYEYVRDVYGHKQ